ncbi:hypothetical protein B0J14DRAFT_707490 [Halenospora varia]|nr:hypothetical protein B0J14DRAFT_707490 [Halenospora varia]
MSGQKRRRQTPEDIASNRDILGSNQKRPCQIHAALVGVIYFTNTYEQGAICDLISPSECQPSLQSPKVRPPSDTSKGLLSSQSLKVRPLSGEAIKDSDPTDTSKGLPTIGGPFTGQQPPRKADALIDVNSKAVSTFTSLSNNREIFFTIPGAVLKYDLDNPIPASRVRKLPLTEFFSLISQHAGIPYSSITCLTFKAVFARHAVTQTELVVSKKAEDKVWAEAKQYFRRMYRMVMSTTPEQRKFEVLVDVGNTQRNLD